ncbi:MAG TPA: efflux RND transporter periplasmic adaptor subunit [Allosphingosinicella sp.]|nr:efflux RND transporter periplasmic adaptor subunit [Allosphingosinicella sp.]
MNEVSKTTVTNEASTDKKSLEVFLGAPAARPWYKRPLYIVGLVGLVLVLLLLSQCFMGTAPGGYATETVRRGNLRVTVSATGNLQPTNEVQVGSEQSGLVTQVFVDNNDRVIAGQPLARLDTSRLQDTITQAQAGLAAAQAQVATAQASAAQARANLARQEEVWRISNHRVPSETELDAARAEARRANASVTAAQAQVAQARAQLSSAQTNLSKATIYSPVTGVVLSRQIDPGQTVAASFQAPVLFTIAEDLAAMKLEVRVDEADVGQVHEGQRASFTVDAWPGRTFPATVTRIDVGANASGSTTSGSSASNATAASGSVVAYTAELAVLNPELLLRPGMTATADIVTAERRGALLVPNAALRWSPERDAAAARGQQGGVTSVLVPRGGRGGRGFGGGGRGGGREVSIGRGSRQTVYVLGADGTPTPVRVIVGESNGSETEIVGGDLRDGQDVITARLAAGQTQDKSARSGRRGRRGGGDEGEAGGNQVAPAAVPPAAQRPGAQPSAAQEQRPARQPEAAQPPAQPQAQRPRPDGARPSAGPGAGPPRGPGGQRMRDMTPEQRRAFFESMTPEQREQMRERRRQWRERREAEGAAPDG